MADDRRLIDARTLRQISTEINTTLDLTQIFGIVLRTMDELFAFEHSLLLLLDERGEFLAVAASRGYAEPGIGARVQVGVGVIGMVAKRRRMMRVNNLAQQRAYAIAVRKQLEVAGQTAGLTEAAVLPGLPDAQSQIAIPMMVKDTLIGVFAVESDRAAAFDEHDEVLVSIVANQAASAIHNAQAHERLRQLAETLEERVRERTAELDQKNRALRETQAQLVQQGKMAALGMLAAGVAHEINTPIGSLRSNAELSASAAKKVRQRLAASPELQGDRAIGRAIGAIEHAAAIDLDACERIERIVGALRNFARLDEAEQKRAELHEGIDSTLRLLQSRLGERISVVRRFGTLPAVLCYPNLMNQVFMNLLANAVDAIEGEGTITIGSRLAGDDTVELTFADTGSGIEAAHLERIFDPGYTTRGVGVGTGLGLAICYRIMQQHGGTIEVDSEVGAGTTFTLRLPLG